MSPLPTDNPTALLQQMHRWRMAFFGLVVLLAGVVIGGSATLLVFKPKPPQPPEDPEVFVLGALRDVERHLTEQQLKQVHQIMREHMEELRVMREEEWRPKIITLMGKLKQDIGKVLTPKQMEIWQQRAKRDQQEFWRRRGGGPGGMRGGPGSGRMGPGGPGSGGPRGGMRPGGGPGGMRGQDDRDGQRSRSGQGGSPMRGPGGMDRRGFGPGVRGPFWRGPNTVPEPNGVPEPNSVSEPDAAPEPNEPDVL
jgi:hypothetical protein